MNNTIKWTFAKKKKELIKILEDALLDAYIQYYRDYDTDKDKSIGLDKILNIYTDLAGIVGYEKARVVDSEASDKSQQIIYGR